MVSTEIPKSKVSNVKMTINDEDIFKELTILFAFLLVDFYVIVSWLGTSIGNYNGYFSDLTYIPKEYYLTVIWANFIAIFLVLFLYFIFKYVLIKRAHTKFQSNERNPLIRIIVLFIVVLCFFVFSLIEVNQPYYSIITGRSYTFSPLQNIADLIGKMLTFSILGFISSLLISWKEKERNKESVKRADRTNHLKKSLKENVLFLYALNFVLLFINYIYSDSSLRIDLLFFLLVTINCMFPFLRLLYDNDRFGITKKQLMVFLSNSIFALLMIYQYSSIYYYKNVDYTPNNYDSSFIYLHAINWGLIVLYSYLAVFLAIYSQRKRIFYFIRKINLFGYFFYLYSVHKLNNNDQAVFFARSFIVIQADTIKKQLPGMLPETVSASFKDIFLNDIERMNQLLKINKIKTYSQKAVLKFVMSIAKPIIVDMQRTLQEHITIELLKKNNDAKNLKVDMEDLWKKVNKIMTQWESTFSDSEMAWKDSLLVK